MPQIGPMEILVVSLLGLIVFGPDKLPDIARTVGGFLRQVRSMADEVKTEFKDGLDVGDEPDDDEIATIAKKDPTGDDRGGLDGEHSDKKGAGGRAGDAGETLNGQRDLPADHPVAEAIKSEREPKPPGGDA